MSDRAKVANSAAQPSVTMTSRQRRKRIWEADSECGSGYLLAW
jgi:hypothetical protein